MATLAAGTFPMAQPLGPLLTAGISEYQERGYEFLDEVAKVAGTNNPPYRCQWLEAIDRSGAHFKAPMQRVERRDSNGLLIHVNRLECHYYPDVARWIVRYHRPSATLLDALHAAMMGRLEAYRFHQQLPANDPRRRNEDGYIYFLEMLQRVLNILQPVAR